MATIKLQPSGKVLIKDGKVACGCCELGCCMYDAQALADEEYEESDLPDAVTIGGVSYLRSGTSYGNTTNGVIFEGDVWAKYTSGVRSSRPCLIQGGVEDQFADTYTITPLVNPSREEPLSFTVTVTRISLCIWRGADACGNITYLVYGDNISLPSPGIDYRWSVSLRAYDPTLACIDQQLRTGTGKENQNTPAGVYPAIPFQPFAQTIIVS